MYYIYCFRNKINEKCYIGQSRTKGRKTRHLYELNKNIHSNCIFQRAFNKYGIITNCNNIHTVILRMLTTENQHVVRLTTNLAR